jgi:hypothetical protein
MTSELMASSSNLTTIVLSKLDFTQQIAAIPSMLWRALTWQQPSWKPFGTGLMVSPQWLVFLHQ